MAPRTSLDVVPRGEYSSSGWSLRKVLVSPPQDMRSDTTETTTRLIEGQIHDTAVLDDYLRKIDAINMIAQVHVSIGALIAEAGAQDGEKLRAPWQGVCRSRPPTPLDTVGRNRPPSLGEPLSARMSPPLGGL